MFVTVESIHARFCRLVQRGDGYLYYLISSKRDKPGKSSLAFEKEGLLPPLAQAQGFPQAEES